MEMSSDKEKFRKMLTEIRSEMSEKLSKLKEIPDREHHMKAFEEITMWYILKHRALFAEFEKWVWSG